MTVLETNATGAFERAVDTVRVRSDSGSPAPSAVLRAFSFVPGEHRLGPSLVEFEAAVPAGGRLAVQIDFDKVFMPTDDFPPDVARGFDVPSAFAECFVGSGGAGGSGAGQWQRVWSEGALAALPGPDLSMPFNVIAFTSTVMAFFIGSLFNMSAEAPERILKRNAGAPDGPADGAGANAKRLCGRCRRTPKARATPSASSS